MPIPSYLIQYGAGKVKAAQDAFTALMLQYAGANVVQQITAAGKTQLIGETVKDVVYWGNTGSLWECYKAAEAIKITPEMAPFLTEATKQQFKNQLIAILSSL